MWKKQTVRDIAIKDKVVLLRADYNVPLERGKVVDDNRIFASLPTLRYLLAHDARQIVVISHLGRPEGRDKAFSLAPVAKRLNKLLGKPVKFYDGIGKMPSARIVMLENLRFNKGEEAGSVEFAKDLVAQTKADLFVQDAFGMVHRAHASMVAVAKLLPSVAGLLLESEVKAISEALDKPKRPLLAIIGGAKVEDKQPLIELFAKTADTVALGGRLGLDYAATTPNVVAPLDYNYNRAGEPYDIGEIATARIIDLIRSAKTIIWNGVVGKVEEMGFSKASRQIAEAIGDSRATSLILGGDTAGFVLGLQEREPSLKYTLISTGGGSALELILGKKMPGIDVLPDKK
ncbi:MAG: phosphoglycerate kinase [Candidatus Nomurabacteria bacterium]|nr:phosphoglycerate kinase [Candidatus Nomurabacteria bacterium]